MTPHDLINRYVHDVTRRLPERLREDVSAELRALLSEELAGQPNPDLEAAKALLLRFGAPDDVAARYAPPALVVEARDTRLFWLINAWLAALFGVTAFVGALAAPGIADNAAIAAPFYADIGGRLLQIVGVMTLVFWAIGAFRRRYPSAPTWQPQQLPAVHDPDHVHRIGWIFAILYFIAGTLILAAPSTFLAIFWGGRMPEAARAALAYDPAFIGARYNAMFVYIALGIALLIYVTFVGRWTRQTRIIQLVLNVAGAGVMIWIIRAGPIFITPPADQLMKGVLALTAIIALIDAGFRARTIWPAKG